jgi:hypothetical protein
MLSCICRDTQRVAIEIHVSGYGIANPEVAANRRRKLRIFSHFALPLPRAMRIDRLTTAR